MNKLKYLVVILIIALSASLAVAKPAEEPGDLPPELLNKIGILYPGLIGPFGLKFKSQMIMNDLDIHVGNYDVIAGGKPAGPVTRITSLDPERKTGNLDAFVRYDDKGNVMGIASLVGLDEIFGISTLSMFFKGKDPRQYKDDLTALMNGLGAGASSNDAAIKPPPPKTYPLEVKQRLLAPGDKLPGLKAKDIDGRDFDTAQFRDRSLIMVFAAADCLRCDDMVRAIETIVSKGNGKGTVAYIVSSDAGSTRSYMEGLEAKGRVISEPADYAARVFLVPFKPYVFAFDRGILKYASAWKGEADLANNLQGLTGGKK